MFEWVGETLRRMRKDAGKTLEQIGKEAHLGRGQLSRIENGHQEATFSTLAKILDSQRISRREFFRRYELVEAERIAAKGPAAAGLEGDGSTYPQEASAWPDEVREVLSQVESFIATSFTPNRPLAQGAIELGDFLVLFRIVPKSGPPPAAPPSPAPEAPPEPGPKRPRAPRSRRKLRTRS